MAEFFLELFSEEIPARMQAGAADVLMRALGTALAPISPGNSRAFHGPRRIAYAAEVLTVVPAASATERGPRISAPEQALAGFLRKHGAERDQLSQDGDFWVLKKDSPAVGAATLIANVLPGLLWRFPWPKNMRWGGTSAFTWIRPLRRVLCLFDGEPVPFSLAQGDDDGHRLASSNLTEGHRMAEPSVFAVRNVADWKDQLSRHCVMVEGRAQAIHERLSDLASAKGVFIVKDPSLVDEVAGLVEWVVPLMGQIDAAFMDLPPEVMQVSMRVNQRYFATSDAAGAPAPWFAFVANLEPPDGGAAIVAGNERVLRARFSDARHFYDLDRRKKLADRVTALDGVLFQAELGTQGARAARIVRLAGFMAPMVAADVHLAERAALLCKADLTTGMVGEFPELQGVMGGYYATHDGEDREVCAAVRDHYMPKGAADDVPSAPVSVAVALADKLDQLAAFFSIGQKPTGSGDPYALRRAALGAIRIIRENGLRLGLLPVLVKACENLTGDAQALAGDVLSFIVERLRVQLRGEGARHDVLTAIFAACGDDDLTRALARTSALAGLLGTDDGINLLAAYRRAANILRIEDKRDGPHAGTVDTALLADEAELDLQAALHRAELARPLLEAEKFTEAMQALAALRKPLDAFFENVTVNAEAPRLRKNRLVLLSNLRESLDAVADFSAIEN